MKIPVSISKEDYKEIRLRARSPFKDGSYIDMGEQVIIFLSEETIMRLERIDPDIATALKWLFGENPIN